MTKLHLDFLSDLAPQGCSCIIENAFKHVTTRGRSAQLIESCERLRGKAKCQTSRVRTSLHCYGNLKQKNISVITTMQCIFNVLIILYISEIWYTYIYIKKKKKFK